jgi:aryl-alcohol dehydrogenase-like predicted oxidoreductase
MRTERRTDWPGEITRRDALRGGAACLAGGVALGALASCARGPRGAQAAARPFCRALGRTGLKVSALSFGGALLVGHNALQDDTKAARQRLIEEALDHGINLFDTYRDEHLDVYACLAPRGDKALVNYKVETMSAEGARREVEKALKTLKRERLDILMPHGQPWGDPGDSLSEVKDPAKWKGVIEAVEEMARLKQQGKAGYVGYVSHSAPHVKRILREHGSLVDVIMVRYGPFPHLDPFAEVIDLCRERDLGVIVFKTLDGTIDYARRLETWRKEEKTWAKITPLMDAGLTPAQACIRYASRRPGVDTALVGLRTSKEIRENLAAL